MRGTTINFLMEKRGSVRGTTRRPSLAIDATLRYRFTSLMLVAFLDGRVPCFRWAWVRRRSGHSAWTSYHADLVVNGRCERFRISWTDAARTTESSVAAMNVHTWQRGSEHSAALQLEKSKGILDGQHKKAYTLWIAIPITYNVAPLLVTDP